MDEGVTTDVRMEVIPSNAKSSTSEGLPTFSSIIKIEPGLENVDDVDGGMDCDLGEFKFSHFLEFDNQEIGERGGTEDRVDEDYSTNNIHIKEEVIEQNEDPFSDYWTPILGNYIKSEPNDEEVKSQFEETESSNSTYVPEDEDDNSDDLDWEVDYGQLKSKIGKQNVRKRQNTKSGLIQLDSSSGSGTKIQNKRQGCGAFAAAFRRTEPTESGRVLNAFQNIVGNLCLTKAMQRKIRTRTKSDVRLRKKKLTPNTRVEEILSPSRSKRLPSTPNSDHNAITSADTCLPLPKYPRLSGTPQTPITHPTHYRSKKIKCAFCAEDFEPRSFAKHYRNYFQPYQCSSCFSTFCDKKSCATHVHTAHKGQDAEMLIGNFLVSNYCHPLLSTVDEEERYWFKCNQCQAHLGNEYFLIDHYKRVHQHVYCDSAKFQGPSSIGSYTAQLNGKTLWSTKVRLNRCDVQVTRMEYANNIQLSAPSLNISSRTDVTPSTPNRRKPTKLRRWSCGLCSKGFTTSKSYELHMTSIHNVPSSTKHRRQNTVSHQQARILAEHISETQSFSQGESILQPSVVTTTSESTDIPGPMDVLSSFVCKQQFLSSQDQDRGINEQYPSYATYLPDPLDTNTIFSVTDNNEQMPTLDDGTVNNSNLEGQTEVFPLMMVKAEHLENGESMNVGNNGHMPLEIASFIVPPVPHARKRQDVDPIQESHICVECFQIFKSEFLLQRHIRSTHVPVTDLSKGFNYSFHKILNKSLKKSRR